MDQNAAEAEYQLLSLGDLELGQLREMLLELERVGWQLDTTYEAEGKAGAGASLDLRLKRMP
jgi:hypothetical protein